jgi:Asp-tRNA(Asn)/Glu-tRNA(Gln) amidotransferase A subunit family amidase
LNEDVCYESATTLGRRLREGELDAVSLCERFLERIEHLDPALKAFRTPLQDRALAAAEAADRQLRAGICLGPLHGVPYATKDLFDVAGTVTSAGSRALENNTRPSRCQGHRKTRRRRRDSPGQDKHCRVRLWIRWRKS